LKSILSLSTRTFGCGSPSRRTLSPPCYPFLSLTACAPFGSIAKMNALPKVLTKDTINPLVLRTEYAVRGELVIKAAEFQQMLKDPASNLPFKEIILCNIGNPQSLGQPPITFCRQVLAFLSFPPMLNNPDIVKQFPPDVIARAKAYLARIPGGTGAYSHSQGVEVVRQEVAQYIQDRDGFPSNPDDIFLTDGASPAVKMVLQACIRGPQDGILVPIPQYPLYSASIALCGGAQIGYYLNEQNGWGLELNELQRALKESRERGINVRALVVINPGNPTGQCLPEAQIRQIIQFAADEKLVLMADEVYQPNIYGHTPFTSFKKVLRSMGSSCEHLELVSFHSVSKGFLGECGRRGGYMELVGFDDAVKAEFYKLASVNLCSNLDGQVMVGLMCNPPRSGDASFELYELERQAITRSLQNRARKLARALNELDGMRCNPVEGALYAFPSVMLPPKAVEAAHKAGKLPDVFYCLKLLEATGICVVPGSGFGQRDGTFHFRTTILPQENKIDGVILRLKDFHAKFLQEYS